MIVFLYGPDSYRREEKKRGILREFRAKHPESNIEHIDAEKDPSGSGLMARFGALSIFDQAELVVVENAYKISKKDFSAIAEAYGASFSRTMVVSESEKPPKHFEVIIKNSGKNGSKKILAQEFGVLEGRSWHDFIKKNAFNLGLELSVEAERKLSELYDGDSWGLITELEKISCLDKKNIKPEDITDFGGMGAPDFFEMIGSFRSPLVSVRIGMLEKLFSSGEPAAKIFNILAYQGKNSVKFSEYDVMIKSGKLEYEEALLDFVL